MTGDSLSLDLGDLSFRPLKQHSWSCFFCADEHCAQRATTDRAITLAMLYPDNYQFPRWLHPYRNLQCTICVDCFRLLTRVELMTAIVTYFEQVHGTDMAPPITEQTT